MGRVRRIKHKEPLPRFSKAIPFETLVAFYAFVYEHANDLSYFNLLHFKDESGTPELLTEDENGKKLWEWHQKIKKPSPNTYDIQELLDAFYEASGKRHWLEQHQTDNNLVRFRDFEEDDDEEWESFWKP